VDGDGTLPDAKEPVMSTAARPSSDDRLADLVEDLAFLGTIFSGAVIVAMIVVLLLLL
jgi:hypothetical protein